MLFLCCDVWQPAAFSCGPGFDRMALLACLFDRSCQGRTPAIIVEVTSDARTPSALFPAESKHDEEAITTTTTTTSMENCTLPSLPFGLPTSPSPMINAPAPTATRTVTVSIKITGGCHIRSLSMT